MTRAAPGLRACVAARTARAARTAWMAWMARAAPTRWAARGARAGWTAGRARAGGDGGQVTILVIGFVVVALALVAVVVSATQVHLERTRLAALADLAALDAAGRVADASYYAPPGSPGPGGRVSGPGWPGPGSAWSSDSGAGEVAWSGEGLALSDEDVAVIVDAYLAGHPDAAARWTDLRVLEADSPDGTTVRVRLGVLVRPAWTAWLLAPFADGIAVEASSSARAW